MKESSAHPSAVVKDCLKLTNECLSRGDHRGAVEHLSSACALVPDSAELAAALGSVLMRMSEFGRAAAAFRRATELRPAADDPHASLAVASRLAGDTAGARLAAENCLKLNCKNLLALKLLARLALDAGDAASAREHCERVHALANADADAAAMLEECGRRQARSGPTGMLGGLLGEFSDRTRLWEELGAEHVLQQFVVGVEPKRVVVRERPIAGEMGSDGLPVPPPNLRMGYHIGNAEGYLRIGRQSYESLQQILTRHAVALEPGDAILDWGCASGRVLRCFTAEAARGCAVWGGDVHAPSITWAKAHLPGFRFFNCSSLPYLPFSEGTFKFVYALSVMTHIIYLRDLWLMEIARVLRRDGIAVLTIHSEHTWEIFQREAMPDWMPEELRGVPQMPGECVDIQGSSWMQTYTFFHSDYVRREWGHYFEVLDIVPRGESRQTAVVLRKR